MMNGRTCAGHDQGRYHQHLESVFFFAGNGYPRIPQGGGAFKKRLSRCGLHRQRGNKAPCGHDGCDEQRPVQRRLQVVAVQDEPRNGAEDHEGEESGRQSLEQSLAY